MRKPIPRLFSAAAFVSALLAAPLVLLAPGARADAPAAATDDAYRAAYKALAPAELTQRSLDALPQLELRRIDVSERMRSASFGHKTFVLVPPASGAGKREFYVEFSKSTNRPASYYGPFPLR